MAQTKGIRIIKPSDSLVMAYFGKSQNALKAMEVNANAGIAEWAVSAAYYARYFAVYALLSKLGIKCEIHDCSIALFEYLFADMVPRTLVEDLRLSKEDRIEHQYYLQDAKIDLVKLAKNANSFVLEMEKILDGLTQERIDAMQKKIKLI